MGSNCYRDQGFMEEFLVLLKILVFILLRELIIYFWRIK